MKEDDAVVALLAPSVISPGSSGADTQWFDLELKRYSKRDPSKLDSVHASIFDQSYLEM